MPNISVFDGLTPDEVAAIENEIKNRNFKNYTELSEWCKSHGWQIERGALWSRGKKIKDRLQMLKDTTDTAIMIGESVKDEGGNLSDATLSLIQAGLFNTMNKVLDDESSDIEALQRRLGMLAQGARASSELGRTSIAVKKYKQEVLARLDSVANKVAETAKRNGLSADVVNDIKREILGVAT